MSTPLLGPVNEALDAILSASEGNGGSYTCGEAEMIVALFVAAGRKDDGELFLDNHAWGDDDEGDLHPVCSQCGEKRAEDYKMCASCLHDAKRSGWEPGGEV